MTVTRVCWLVPLSVTPESLKSMNIISRLCQTLSLGSGRDHLNGCLQTMSRELDLVALDNAMRSSIP